VPFTAAAFAFACCFWAFLATRAVVGSTGVDVGGLVAAGSSSSLSSLSSSVDSDSSEMWESSLA
jgi:hypothetical protein